MGEIHLYIYRIYPVPTQGSICASVRDDQTSWTPKPDTFLVENHNSHRYDLSPPATTEHLRNATCHNLGPEISYYVYDFYAQSEISPQERFFQQTQRHISAMNSFGTNSVPVLRSAISIYRRNRKESAKRLLVQNSLCKQRRVWWDICQSCLSKIQRPIHSGMWSSSAWHLIHYTWARNHHQTEEWWSIVSARTFVLPKKLDLFVGTQCVLHTVYTLFTTQAQSRFDPDMRKVDWICRDAKEKSWYFSKAYCTIECEQSLGNWIYFYHRHKVLYTLPNPETHPSNPSTCSTMVLHMSLTICPTLIPWG